MPLALTILQAAAIAATPALPADSPRPTIELHAKVHADRIVVVREGEAHLRVTATPALSNTVEVRRSKPLPNAAAQRNFDMTLDAQATIDPGASSIPQIIQGTQP